MIVSVASASVLAASADAQVLSQPLPTVSLPAPALPAPSPALPVPTAPLPVPTAPLPAPELPELAPLVQRPDTSLTSPLPVPDTSGSPPGVQLPAAGVAALDAQTGAGRAAAPGTAGSTVAPAAARSTQRSGATARRDARLDGKRLRRLRTVLREHWSCAGSLSTDQRRALILRAGLFGKKPLPRTAIARRLGVTPTRALRLERSGVAALRRGGTCDEGGGTTVGAAGAGAAAEPTAWSGPGSPEPAEAKKTARPEREVGAVLGAFRSSRPDLALEFLGGRERGTSASLLTLLAFLAALCALLLAAAVATRRAGVPPTLLARRRRRFQKPLLFLDVDGVITIWPPIPPGHPGRRHDLGTFWVYISDRCGEFIRALETRYEIVWATGWEGDANRYLRGPLGLERNLPTLKFGDDALWGTSDWKIPAIERAAGRRPVAWLDDTIGAAHRSWARQREAPTLLVQTQARGISLAHVKELLAWADSLAEERDGAVLGDRTPSAV